VTHRSFPSGKFDAPSQSMGFLLWQTTNLWQRKIKASLAPFDLTHVQFVLLAGLSWLEQEDDDGAITQKRLAKFCGTDTMMTSQVLRTLERAKLIERLAHPNDARAVRLNISDYGAKKLADALVSVEDADASFFSKIGPQQLKFSGSLRQLLV
jgi:MarR family transcriptional regulator, organic hydroperoxide resistance regulator